MLKKTLLLLTIVAILITPVSDAALLTSIRSSGSVIYDTPDVSLILPQPGDITYGGTPPGSTYGPMTEKVAMIQNFLALANANPSLVTVQSIGKCYPKQGYPAWDLVIFKVGNPSGGRVMWDSCMHGLEDAGVEVIYALYKWLLAPTDTQRANANLETRRQRILANNYIAFFPYVDWRWSRMNFNYDANPASGTDGDGDGLPYGVNLARDFRNSHEEGLPDNYAPPGPYTQPETQAIVNFWNTWNDAGNWFYANLHQGTSYVGGSMAGPLASQCRTLRDSIYASLFGGSPSQNIGNGNYASSADAEDYYGCSGGFWAELGGWARTYKTSLTSGAIHKDLLSLLAAMCELVETPS